MDSVKLTPVALKGYWRVKMTWPNKTLHFFGKFLSRAEAMDRTTWLQHQEPTSRASDKR